MIEKLVVRNLQVHEKLAVTFAPHVTTITGPTNSGKSTIVRALLLAGLNRPPRGTYRRGGKELSIALTAEGKTVTRGAGKAHWYAVPGHAKKLKAVGRKGEVPQAVQNLLNLCPDNFQRQRDPAFWFASTPGQVSKDLNAVVDLSVIDRCLASAGAKSRKASAEVDVAKDRVATAIARKAELAGAVENAEKVAELVRLYRTARETAQSFRLLRNLLRKAESAKRAVRFARRAKTHGEKAVRAGTLLATTARKCESLGKLLAALDQAKADAARRPPDVRPLLAVRARADATAEGCRELERLLDELQTQRKLQWRAEASAEKARATLAAKSRELKVCPACGQRLPRKPRSPSSRPTGISV